MKKAYIFSNLILKMEASITSKNLETKGTESKCTAEIFYNGIGCKFRNYISEREFRDIS